MYVQEISIEIKTEADIDEVFEDLDLLISFYRSNGQTQGKIESQYLANKKIVCLPFTMEQDSLNKKFNNSYVTRQIKKIEKNCNAVLQFKTVGKTSKNYKRPCQCEKPAFYILITDYITIEPPITCGTCNEKIPLYRLPIYYDDGYIPILSWETNYISCDSLQMNCEIGERWALNQMQKIDFQLSKQGLTWVMENSTFIPF